MVRLLFLNKTMRMHAFQMVYILRERSLFCLSYSLHYYLPGSGGSCSLSFNAFNTSEPSEL